MGRIVPGDKTIGSFKMSVDSIKWFGIIADDITGAMDGGAGFLGTAIPAYYVW